MSIETLMAPLSCLPIFQGIEPGRLREIARRAERLVYKAGDLIIEEGSPAEGAVLIVTGKAIRVAGPELPDHPELVPVGSLLGEMAMLIPTEYGATVVARSPVRALRLLRSDMLELMEHDPELSNHFLHVIAGRLSALAVQLREADELFAQSVSKLPLWVRERTQNTAAPSGPPEASAPMH